MGNDAGLEFGWESELGLRDRLAGSFKVFIYTSKCAVEEGAVRFGPRVWLLTARRHASLYSVVPR